MEIHSLTLNPAIDLAVDCAELRPNEKLRCTQPNVDPGGGGVNVSRAIQILGGNSQALVAAGGPTGQQLLELLRREHIDVTGYTLRGETRQSFTATALDSGHQYRFVLPGPTWTMNEQSTFADWAVEQTASDDLLVASGSLPPGLEPSFYANLADRLGQAGRRVILDTSGAALMALVNSGAAARAKPTCLRMNKPEAESVAQTALGSASEIVAFGRSLLDDGVAQMLAIADGANGAYFFASAHQYFVRAPTVQRRSAIGAGDSFVAALTLGLSRDWNIGDIGRFAVACASAALTTPATDLCDREIAETLFAELEAQSL